MNVLIMNEDHWLAMLEETRLGVIQLCHVVVLQNVKTNLYSVRKNVASTSDKNEHLNLKEVKQLLKDAEAFLSPRVFD